MAKNSIRDFDNTAGNNTDIQSVDIAENCAPSGINNAIRELMADMADVNDGTVALVSPAMDSADINGGTLDGTVIGGTTPAAGTFTTGDFNTSLNVDGTVTSDGLTVDGAVDISYGDYQNSGAIKIGADLGQNTSRTDASRKFGAITAAHFDNDEADLGLITMDSSSTSVSALTIGGGSSSFNSASTITFQTSSDGASAGTTAMVIDASQNVGIGTSSPSSYAKFTLQGLGTEAIPTDSLVQSNDASTLQTIWNSDNSANYSGIKLETRTSAASGWLIANEWKSSYLGDLVFRGRSGASTSAERMRIDSSGQVGIGTSSPNAKLTVNTGNRSTDGKGGTLCIGGDADTAGGLTNNTRKFGFITVPHYENAEGNLWLVGADAGASSNDIYIGGAFTGYNAATSIRFNTAANSTTSVGTERMRIDSSGNTTLAKSSTNTLGTVGHDFGVTGYAMHTRASSNVLYLNRTTSDGNIAEFYKDGSTVGSIFSISANSIAIGQGNTNLRMHDGSLSVRPVFSTGTNRDNAIDLGTSSARFDDIYATNGTIQTSDANEKQQIASLTDAEITAAKAISKLFKTFKWNDSVEEKGDAARTHAGVIAQDVQQAMTDAGLDAGDYAFFISATWWETQTEVPAVKAVEAQDAVYDDDGNLVSEAVEAVEAQDAYIRIESYDTAEEAPEGATERTRMGIRYPELLAFIGAATEQRLADIETRLTALETL